MTHTLPDLPYAHDALEPHIDARTMEIHHGKHHATYLANMLKALEGKPEAQEPIEQIVGKAGQLGAPVRNNAGGFLNHNIYWTCMSPDGGGDPAGQLGEAVTEQFGSADSLREQLVAAGLTRFGSGFAWLILKDGKLKVVSTPNQDNPLMEAVVPEDARGVPLLGIDVWEHAYYLNYQNRRPDYLKAFWEIVNWKSVGERYERALAAAG